MQMKDHILAALKEQFDEWEKLLTRLTDQEINKPQFDLGWSIKYVIAHLWAWQQISIARLQGGLQDREPDFPTWIVESVENWEEDANRVNNLTFETLHASPWSEIYQMWRNGFLQFLALGEKISERDLLDGDRYPWLHGYSLAFIIIASYDHHQEHYEKILKQEQANPDSSNKTHVPRKK
jgi:hypothetical protein